MELVLDAKAIIGEGAIWCGRESRLYWVDIEGRKLHCYEPASGRDRSFDLGQMIGTVVPRTRGGVMVSLEHGFASFDLESNNLELWAQPEKDVQGNRFNDGKCDPAGRFWGGSISLKRTPGAASLYCLEPDGSVRTMLQGVTNSNGIAWSLDAKTMYYIDTPTRQVDAFDYDMATGQISNRRTVIRVPQEIGKPDGMTVDAEGMLWIALWTGGCVSRWDPQSGQLLQTIPVPVRKVTSCAFSGPDLRDLYITTACSGMTEAELAQEPHAGGLFLTRTDVPGVPAYEFAG